jgi:replicative DNA helicase Mcm
MADKDFQTIFIDYDESTSSNIAIDEYIEVFQEFLEAVYKRDVEFLAANYPDQRSIEIDFKKLEAYDLTLAERLIEDPHTMIDAANAAIKKIDVGVLEQEADVEFDPRIRFFNLPEESKISIRDVGSECLSKLISVEGMIRQITERLEKMTVAHFVCRRCQNSYDIKQLSQQLKKPVMCECKSREFDLDLEQSKFIDYQKIQVQEPLESLKGSEQASHMEVYLSEDLVNLCSAGDKIIITGIVKLKTPKTNDSNIYQKYMIANHI